MGKSPRTSSASVLRNGARAGVLAAGTAFAEVVCKWDRLRVVGAPVGATAERSAIAEGRGEEGV